MMKNIDVAIFDKKLSLDTAYQSVLDDSCGGNCMFIGTVRNHNKGESITHLDFEVFESMAIKEMRKIAERALEKFEIERIAIHHREGYVGIRDIAVIIVVSSHHRKASFEACEYAIDQLKETVPIWKKEHLIDGNYWVGSRP